MTLPDDPQPFEHAAPDGYDADRIGNIRQQVVEPATRGDRIFREIEFDIISGRLPMGTKLGEETLANHFGVSRGPLREALRRLEGGGLVVRLPHLGVRVVSLSRADLIEVYEVREVLEGLAARLAARNMTESALRNLEMLIDRDMKIVTAEGHVYPRAFGDEDVHYLIADASGSFLLRRLLCGDLYSLIRLCRYRSTENDQSHSYRDHMRIVDAIKNRDGEMAEILMRRHIHQARERLKYIDIPDAPIGTSDGSTVLSELKAVATHLAKESK
jgi:DNA-binding GntR family transcriptional regulator